MKIAFLSLVAKALGIQFKVDGLPYGAVPRFIEPGDCS